MRKGLNENNFAKHIAWRKSYLLRIFKKNLHKGLRQLGSSHVRQPWRSFWQPEYPTTGYCYPVCEILYHYILSPTQYRPYIIKLKIGGNHWFMKNIFSGKIIDLTADQFRGEIELDYSTARRANFLTPVMSRRACLVAEATGVQSPALVLGI